MPRSYLSRLVASNRLSEIRKPYEACMIEKITIKNAATYGSSPQDFGGLAKINFIYGSNGTGKTTISRIIADAQAYPDCVVTWQRGTPLETLVYSRDFIDKNFNQPEELEGIFTLGEKDQEILDKISSTQKDLTQINDAIAALKTTLEGGEKMSGKIDELKKVEDIFTEECWKLKQKHDATLKDAFTGYRASKNSFKRKLLDESIKNNAASVSLVEIKAKAQTVFDRTPQHEEVISVPDCARLLAHEANPILMKRVIGNSDVNIAALINRLNNSDWVKRGRKYYDANDRICPFCQQSTNDSLERSLTDYFDDAFQIDSETIEKLCNEYKSDSEHLQLELQKPLENPPTRLDIEKFQNLSEVLDSKIRLNIQLIDDKRRESSKSIDLDSLRDTLDGIKKLLDAANSEIRTHNMMVDNIQSEKICLTKQVWRYLLDHEIKSEFISYKNKKAGIETAITNLNKKIDNKIEEKREKEQEIRALERDTTSIQPTIDDINGLLQSFGFQGFTLQKSDRDRYYKIQRADGSDAKETLSEGERSFIAFLYFYYLLKGSTSETGVTADRVVVFDDPVSSLDSNVLFVVSSLIKKLFRDVRDGSSTVKQVFIFTHNMYFHKEVSFDRSRVPGQTLADETFWEVRKPGFMSEIKKNTENPIRTTYEFLWAEVRRVDSNSLSIQNTLRRILEYYFKILGNIDPDDVCSRFEGPQQLICKSLFSWINAGSHSAHEDLDFSPDEFMIETYLVVFREIFEKTGHVSHYKMMMGEDMNGG